MVFPAPESLSIIDINIAATSSKAPSSRYRMRISSPSATIRRMALSRITLLTWEQSPECPTEPSPSTPATITPYWIAWGENTSLPLYPMRCVCNVLWRFRSRSKSPGVFSKSTVASRQKQKESVDYMFGQYAFTPDLPPPAAPQPRPEPDWERRPSQTCSEDSKMSSFRSFGSSSGSEGNGRKSSFKKSATKLNG